MYSLTSRTVIVRSLESLGARRWVHWMVRASFMVGGGRKNTADRISDPIACCKVIVREGSSVVTGIQRPVNSTYWERNGTFASGEPTRRDLVPSFGTRLFFLSSTLRIRSRGLCSISNPLAVVPQPFRRLGGQRSRVARTSLQVSSKYPWSGATPVS